MNSKCFRCWFVGPLLFSLVGCGGSGGGLDSSNPIVVESIVTITAPPDNLFKAYSYHSRYITQPPPRIVAPTPTANLLPNRWYVPGTSEDFSSSVDPYPEPLTLTISFVPSQIPNGGSPANLQICFVSNGAWTPVSSSTVDLTSNTVTATITQTGTYGILVVTP